jgi:DNA-directed RNA polymerase subunit RPC12/RpoP
VIILDDERKKKRLAELDKKHCTRKIMYTSRMKAEIVMERHRLEDMRNGRIDERGDLHVYKCSNCGGYHIGHPIKEMLRAESY